MATQPVKQHWTVAEYLAHEQTTGIRHEYLDGEIFAMSGGSENHSLITANALITLGQALRPLPCRVYSSDLKVKISNSRYVYPDVSVVCGEAEFADESRTQLTNPTLVVEVMSPSTADYDRGSKGDFYRSLASLQAYLLFDQDRAFAQVYTRHQAGWLLREFSAADTIQLDAPSIEIPLLEIYRNVSF